MKSGAEPDERHGAREKPATLPLLQSPAKVRQQTYDAVRLIERHRIGRRGARQADLARIVALARQDRTSERLIPLAGAPKGF